jgi:hypothetical protein
MGSIIVGAIVMFVIGAVWFTVLFGKIWSRLMNRTPEQMAKQKADGMGGKMVVMFILNLISASVLHYLLPITMALSIGEFLTIMVIIWLGFTLPSLANTYLWEGKSTKFVLINAGGSLAAFIGGAVTVFLMM